MFRILPLLLVFILTLSMGNAQNDLSWKKQKKVADQLYEEGNYAEAATFFEKAWQQHPQSSELIYKAGECYYLLKDFKKASQAYQHIKEKNDEFEFVGLKYARSLKQDEQYEAAKREFVYFLNAYQGEDKSILTQIASTEVKGCELALQLAASNANETIEVRHLGGNVNSLKTEFAPIPFAEDLLYFSSTIDSDKAFIYRTQKQKGEWSQAVRAENLPELPDKHLANGSFTPDAKRFYFTLCNAATSGNGLASICAIYVLKRETNGWSEPIAMRDYINEAGATTTQPWVVHKDGKEILYFSSDRKGGKGGMDIWCTSRDLNSGDIDFTYPVNLGKQINSIGDEITPFYDEKDGALYFSSNGHVSLGGWDIFKAIGSEQTWELPENLGIPINSGADDFYYVLKPSRKSGFLVSNRLSGLDKISTRHEDIFEFSAKTTPQELVISGEVLAKESTADLNNSTVSLYEILGKTERLLQTKRTSANKYKFPVLPNKKFRLVVENEGYQKNIFDFHTGQGYASAVHDFYLSKVLQGESQATSHTTTPATSSSIINYSTAIVEETFASREGTNSNSVVSATNSASREIYTTPINVTKSNDKSSYSSTAAPIGVYYKIQLIAVNYHSDTHTRYREVKNLGRLETEAVPGKEVTRVLLANFATKQEAQLIMAQAQQFGFTDAFIVKYRDGQRIGTMSN